MRAAPGPRVYRRSPFSPPFPTISWLNPPRRRPHRPQRVRAARAVPPRVVRRRRRRHRRRQHRRYRRDRAGARCARDRRARLAGLRPAEEPRARRARHRLDPVLDTDEVVTPELAQSIRDTIRAPAAQVYAVDRLSSFCGQWIHHSGWYPDWIPRLFRRGAARFGRSRARAPRVRRRRAAVGKLMHYSYEDFETVRKLDAYSTAGARQRARPASAASARRSRAARRSCAPTCCAAASSMAAPAS